MTKLVSDWQQILASHPMNKAAAIVTGRNRDSVDEHRDRERRRDLVAALNATERAIGEARQADKHELGLRKLRLQAVLHEQHVAIQRLRCVGHRLACHLQAAEAAGYFIRPGLVAAGVAD